MNRSQLTLWENICLTSWTHCLLARLSNFHHKNHFIIINKVTRNLARFGFNPLLLCLVWYCLGRDCWIENQIFNVDSSSNDLRIRLRSQFRLELLSETWNTRCKRQRFYGITLQPLIVANASILNNGLSIERSYQMKSNIRLKRESSHEIMKFWNNFVK